MRGIVAPAATHGNDPWGEAVAVVGRRGLYRSIPALLEIN